MLCRSRVASVALLGLVFGMRQLRAVVAAAIAVGALVFGVGSARGDASSVYVCEDVNNNGVCDAGEPDLTQILLKSGTFTTQNSIVVAKGLNVKQSQLNLTAGRDIRINETLATGGFRGMNLQADRLVLAPGAVINAGGPLFVFVDTLIQLGAKATIKAFSMLVRGQEGIIAGAGEGPRFVADYGDVDLASGFGPVMLGGRKALMQAGNGDVLIQGVGQVVMDQTAVIATQAHVIASRDAAGNDASILWRNGVAKVPNGPVQLSASLCDMTGTVLVDKPQVTLACD